MDIDEGMIVTVEELGLKFVVTGIMGDYARDYDGNRVYCRIDAMKLIPLRMRDERDAVMQVSDREGGTDGNVHRI